MQPVHIPLFSHPTYQYYIIFMHLLRKRGVVTDPNIALHPYIQEYWFMTGYSYHHGSASVLSLCTLPIHHSICNVIIMIRLDIRHPYAQGLIDLLRMSDTICTCLDSAKLKKFLVIFAMSSHDLHHTYAFAPNSSFHSVFTVMMVSEFL
jgi:hypothetical protein